MKLERHRFRITGMRDILMNNPAKMKAPTGKPVEGKGGPKDVIPAPEEEAASSVYKLPSGQLCGPAEGFRSGLISCAKGKKAGKAALAPIIKAAVFTVQEMCPLVNARTGKAITTWAIDTRRAVLQKIRGVVRSRARVSDWQTTVTLEIDVEQIAPENVLNLFRETGVKIGWLDYRIERGGQFGSYSVEMLEEQPQGKRKRA